MATAFQACFDRSSIDAFGQIVRVIRGGVLSRLIIIEQGQREMAKLMQFGAFLV